MQLAKDNSLSWSNNNGKTNPNKMQKVIEP